MVAGKVESINLSLHNDLWCGGGNVYIELNQGDISCKTTQKVSFYRGTTLSWSGSALGTCCGKNFLLIKDNLSFKLRSTNENDFCPKSLSIFMDSGPFYVKTTMEDWVEKTKGDHSRTATKKGE